MVIKDVILQEERDKVAAFLAESGLNLEENVDSTLYIEDENGVTATISSSNYIIKCLAVKAEYRSENYAALLVGEMLKRLQAKGINYYQVFTKPEYRALFTSMGFRPLLQTDNCTVLEYGDGDVCGAIDKLRVQIKFTFGINDFDGSVNTGCVVINGNPFTEGHLSLVRYAAERHDCVIVFILEEEGQMFSFKERYAMAYLALQPLKNVIVLPSTKYIVSRSTFPSYFLKTNDAATEEYARYDAMIFEKYFIPRLGIKKRYVGSETVDYMLTYNLMLQSVLKEKLEVVPRFKDEEEIISARRVRQLIQEGKVDEALRFIPKNNYALIKGMISNKHD